MSATAFKPPRGQRCRNCRAFALLPENWRVDPPAADYDKAGLCHVRIIWGPRMVSLGFPCGNTSAECWCGHWRPM